jgi:predicted nucleic acid-binding Zn ribbon protein
MRLGNDGPPPSDRRPPSDLERLGSLVEEVLGQALQKPAGRMTPAATPTADGNPGDDTARRIATIWDGTVGAAISANARPVHFRDGRLAVATSSSGWAQSLQLMSEQIRAALNRALGGDLVTTLSFRHAGWERPGR